MRKFIVLLTLLLMSTFILTACNPTKSSDIDENAGETISDEETSTDVISIEKTSPETINKSYQIYEEIINTINAGISLDFNLDFEMIDNNNPSQVKKMFENRVHIFKSNTNIDIFRDITNVHTDGNQYNNKMYFKDGHYYEEAIVFNYDIELSRNRAKREWDLQTYLEKSETKFLEFKKEAVKEATIAEHENGKVISFVLDEEKMTQLLTIFPKDMKASYIEGNDIKFDDVNVEIGVDKDNTLTYFNILSSIEIQTENENQVMTYTSKTKINKIGDDVKIDFPEDLDEYPEMSPAIKELIDNY